MLLVVRAQLIELHFSTSSPSPHLAPPNSPLDYNEERDHPMDPSGIGTCAQARSSGDEYNLKHLQIKMSHAGAASEAITAHADDRDSISAPNGGLQPLSADFRGGKVDEMVKRTKEQKGWRKVIRNFTPS